MSELTERLKGAADRLGYIVENGGDPHGYHLIDMNAIDEAVAALDAQEARIAELEKAVVNAIDLVDRDVIRVRPSDQDELLDGLKMWNEALTPSLPK